MLPTLNLLRITVIAPFSFGYIDALVEKLKAREDVQVTYINTGDIKFRYSSPFQKIRNFFLKTFAGRSLKKKYTSQRIREIIDPLPKQEVILVIRGDKLEKEMLLYLNSKSEKLISYYFDANKNIRGQESLIPLFDEVYSYEKEDVEKHNLRFITNFIPQDTAVTTDGEGVFNISSYDDRYPVLQKIGEQLQTHNFPFKIIVRKEEPIPSKIIEMVPEYLPLEEVQKYIESSAILLDIQKEDQQGLSFRVFEALGYDKKLITSNRDIVNYDFYDPANILVIDKQNPVISMEFLQAPFSPVPEEIKTRYRRDYWINSVLGLKE